MTVVMNDSNVLKDKGNTLFKEAKYNEALECYIDAIQMDPSQWALYTNAANCYFKLGEYERSIEMSDEALTLCPTLTKAVYRRGLAYGELRLFKGAVEDLRRVLKAMPNDVEVKKKLAEYERELQRALFSTAIRKDSFRLDRQSIDKIEVDSTYAGPRVEGGLVDIKFVTDLIAWYRQDQKLHPRYVFEVLLLAKQMFEQEPSLVKINLRDDQQLTICGDTHGQFFDLVKLFELNGLPSDRQLFNGDFVDRGAHSVEVILTMLALKCALPKSMFMSRGNHESESVNRIYGFYEELTKKYDANMHSVFTIVLNCLPLAYVVEDAWFVVHGGLPEKPDFSLADFDQINRFCTPENGTLMSQLLWSDPQAPNGIAPSHRGEGILFGPDVTKAFLERNGLQKIIRSHVWEPTGYKVDHDGQCITIFSAPNYTGAVSSAAFINTDKSLNLKFVQFDAAEYQGKAVKPRPAVPTMY